MTQSLMERFDPATNAWEPLPPMSEARFRLGVSVASGKIYALGGLDDDDDFLSSVERFDPVSNAWEALPPMSTERADFAVVAV